MALVDLECLVKAFQEPKPGTWAQKQEEELLPLAVRGAVMSLFTKGLSEGKHVVTNLSCHGVSSTHVRLRSLAEKRCPVAPFP